jgi:hypothetical protein
LAEDTDSTGKYRVEIPSISQDALGNCSAGHSDRVMVLEKLEDFAKENGFYEI